MEHLPKNQKDQLILMMLLATVELPPYLYNPQQASIEFLEYKRYRMSDIRALERKNDKNLRLNFTSLSIH